MNYLVMTLTKHVQGLYKENYKTEEGNQKRSERDIPCIYQRQPKIVKMSILLSLIYRFNIIPIEIPASFFGDTDKLKLIWYNGDSFLQK